MKSKTYVSPLFVVLSAVFITCMILANTISNRQLAIGPWNTPAGVLVFPVTYIISDIFSEVYGYGWSRKISLIGFALNLFAVGIFSLVNIWPAPIWFADTEAFKTVLGSTWRILVAGFVAYQIGDWANDVIFSKLRTRAYGKHGVGSSKGFWGRALLSSFIGEVFDSCIFMPLAFLGVLPLAQLPVMILIQVLFKTGYEVIIIPVTSVLVKYIRKVDPGVREDGRRLTFWGTTK